MKHSITNTIHLNIREAVIWWFITAGYMGLIFFLSSRSGVDLPELPKYSDKIVHACVYFVLAYFFSVAFSKSGVRKYLVAVVIISATLYGITDEIHQLFVPGRYASVGDVVADFTGAFLWSLLALYQKKYDKIT